MSDEAKEIAQKALDNLEEVPVVLKGTDIKSGLIMSSYDRINYPSNGWKPRKFSNVSKVDTKGFIPLEVQIKRYLLAGVRLQTLRNQYTSEDYLEAYSDIPTITEDMDFTEIQEICQRVNDNLKRLREEREQEFSTESEAVENSAPQGNAELSTDPKAVEKPVSEDSLTVKNSESLTDSE